MGERVDASVQLCLPPFIALAVPAQRPLAARHLLPFPWTLSLHRRWCPSASHRPVSFLSLLGLPSPLFPFPFPWEDEGGGGLCPVLGPPSLLGHRTRVTLTFSALAIGPGSRVICFAPFALGDLKLAPGGGAEAGWRFAWGGWRNEFQCRPPLCFGTKDAFVLCTGINPGLKSG